MISCDKCSEWYHGRCVGISPQEAEEWGNQDYICSGCKIKQNKTDPPQVSLNPTGLRREDHKCPVRTGALKAARRGVGLPRRKRAERVDGDAHNAPLLGRSFQGRKEATKERKRRRNRQKERQAEETARLHRALRDAQQRRTPQSRARDRAGVSEQNSFQGGGRRDTGVSWKRTPQRDYTPTGTGVSGQRTPQNYNSQRETGVSGHRTPQGGCQVRGTGVSSQGTPQRDCRPRETGVSGQRTPQGATSQRRLQQDYVLRETGVSGQRAPQFDTPKESDLPTLQRCPIQGCPIRALDIQPHVMLEHVAEVFREPTGSARASLAPIRVAALQAQAWMLVGGDLEGLGGPH
ncbi:Hypothetical predicted protein [Mytilus galloprovincialis]|uniref:PHD-type domain-containing protein n=1 Tax=Mytilus galloprovincialis TaxID=29158 RepID=A0A8B6HH82_MYTGA|nr:Hypothetical predicted protein [Mytilus galloprovincialis]